MAERWATNGTSKGMQYAGLIPFRSEMLHPSAVLFLCSTCWSFSSSFGDSELLMIVGCVSPFNCFKFKK
jgi:hypothetical protein